MKRKGLRIVSIVLCISLMAIFMPGSIFVFGADSATDQAGSGDLIQLAAPTDLAWDADTPGLMTFQVNQPYQGRFDLKIYREEETEPIFKTSWGWDIGEEPETLTLNSFIKNSDEYDSGNYYFTIQCRGDGVEYTDSEVVTSEVWTYTKPSAKLPAFDYVSWQWPRAKYGFSDEHPDCCGYDVKWYFSATPDGEKKENGGVSSTYYGNGFKESGSSLDDSRLQKYGEGYYFFRARPLSNNILKIQNGPWSEFSEPYYYSGSSVAEQLSEIVEAGGTDGEVRDAVQNLDRDALRKAMLTDTAATGAVAAMAQLEKSLSTTFAVDSSLDAFNNSEVGVVGALLNPVTSDQVVLNIGRPQAEHVLPTLYKQSLALQFSMELNGVENANNNLAVPVVMTLPVPASINPDFLVILHYPAGGGDPEKIDRSQYYLYQERGQWFVRFVLDHFSDFVMTQEDAAEPLVIGDANGDGKVNAQDRVILSRHLAKWPGYGAENIDMAAMDINKDNKVNAQDRVILSRYLAKWGGEYDEYFK